MPREDSKETFGSVLEIADKGISSFSEELAKFKAAAVAMVLPSGENNENQPLHRHIL